MLFQMSYSRCVKSTMRVHFNGTKQWDQVSENNDNKSQLILLAMDHKAYQLEWIVRKMAELLRRDRV
jgi:hypothetical protein